MCNHTLVYSPWEIHPDGHDRPFLQLGGALQLLMVFYYLYRRLKNKTTGKKKKGKIKGVVG